MTTTPNSLPDTDELLAQFWSARYGVPAELDMPRLERLLSKAKGNLFTMPGAGFLGSLICNHTFIWDKGCPTAWCNGETIAFNPWFFLAIPPPARITVLAHEAYHTGFDHMGRVGPRDPQDWNQAADFVINLKLKDDGYSFDGIPITPCLSEDYRGMFTEQVYAEIHQPKQKQPSNCNQPGSGQGPSGPGGPQPPQNSPGPGQSGGKEDPFLPGNTDLDNLPDMSGDLRKPPSTPGAEQARMTKIVQATQVAKMSKDAGSIPGEIETVIDKFLNPILPWEAILRNHFSELSQDDFSWRRPSRRMEDEYLPSLLGENGLEHVASYQDVSGSISDREMLWSNSEAKSIYDEFEPERITLCTFDTRIQNVIEMERDDAFEKMTITGRGGTRLEPVFKHAKELQPNVMLVFSDMHVPSIPDDPGIPVIWIVMANPKVTSLPYGKIIHVTKEAIKAAK